MSSQIEKYSTDHFKNLIQTPQKNRETNTEPYPGYFDHRMKYVGHTPLIKNLFSMFNKQATNILLDHLGIYPDNPKDPDNPFIFKVEMSRSGIYIKLYESGYMKGKISFHSSDDAPSDKQKYNKLHLRIFCEPYQREQSELLLEYQFTIGHKNNYHIYEFINPRPPIKPDDLNREDCAGKLLLKLKSFGEWYINKVIKQNPDILKPAYLKRFTGREEMLERLSNLDDIKTNLSKTFGFKFNSSRSAKKRSQFTSRKRYGGKKMKKNRQSRKKYAIASGKIKKSQKRYRMIPSQQRRIEMSGRYNQNPMCMSQLYNYRKKKEYSTYLRIIECVIIKNRIFVLASNNICYCFDRNTGRKIKQINNRDTQITSLNFNQITNDLIFSYLEMGSNAMFMYKLHYNFNPTYDFTDICQRIFGQQGLSWPGFFEADLTNKIILIFNTNLISFWSLENYQLVHSIDTNDINDIRSSPGYYMITYTENNNKKKIDILKSDFTTLYKTFYINVKTNIRNPNPINDMSDGTLPDGSGSAPDLSDDTPVVGHCCECCGCQGLTLKQFKKCHKGKGSKADWAKDGRLNQAYHLQKGLPKVLPNLSRGGSANTTAVTRTSLSQVVREEDLRELSFVEQLNDYLFIKYNDIDLIILDMVSNKFEFLKNSRNCTPGSFIFFYRSNQFLYFGNYNIELYLANGLKKFNFEDHHIHASNGTPTINEICHNENHDIIISVCNTNVHRMTINISCIHTGKLIKRIIPSDLNLEFDIFNIEKMKYDDLTNELFILTRNGKIIILGI